jgi:purine nucleosidase
LGPIPEASDDPVFVFTDPGIDDALALALLARLKKPRLLGGCGVDGNIPSKLAARNLAALFKLFRAGDLPVFQSPVNDPTHEYATQVHGKNGLGNVRLPSAPIRENHDVMDYLESQSSFQILSLGPLTAVAELLKNSPKITSKVSRCTIMGGGFEGGNATPYAEFNIYSNPEAGNVVFRSSLPKILIPLDVTESVRLWGDDLEELERSENDPSTKALARMLKFYFLFEKKNRGFFGGFMHDPSAVVALSYPELFEFRQAKVRVDTTQKETRGRTVAKFSYDAEANTWIALGVNELGVRKVIMEGLVEK